MNRQETKIKRAKFIELLRQGKTAKEISKEINISEKTLSQWRRDLSQWDYIKLTKELRARLDKAIKSPEATPTDICSLTNALAKLERLAKTT